MYDTNIIPTYHFYDKKFRAFIVDKFDPEDVDDLEDCSDIVYRADFLRAFSLKTLDTSSAVKILNNVIGDIYRLIIIIPEFKRVFDSYQVRLASDNMIAFKMLFSYDYFFAMHNCIRSVMNNEELKIVADILILERVLQTK